MLKTHNPNNYSYVNAYLEIHILGGIKFNNLERMRVTMSVQKPKSINVLRHSIDLYNDTMVEKFVRKIAERIEIGTSVTRKTLQELTAALEQYRMEELEREKEANQTPVEELTANEEQVAIKFLKSKNLLKKTNDLIGKSGVIGEETSRLLMYLIFTSRKTNNPLHCISLGSSGVGKTHLQT